MYQQDDFDTKIIKNFLSLILVFGDARQGIFFDIGEGNMLAMYFMILNFFLYNIICSSPIFLHYLSLASEQLK